MSESTPALLEEQKAYYRARAGEYDNWFFREGRYDRGPAFREQWFAEVEEVRVALAAWLEPGDDVLELAGGTGIWTEFLGRRSASVTVLEASAETLAISRARCAGLPVVMDQVDLFEWNPSKRFPRVFFAFWLSHVPLDRFGQFWANVGRALEPGGSVFIVDSLLNPQSTAINHDLTRAEDDETLERVLDDGRAFRIVKRFYSPESLSSKMAELGWACDLPATSDFFLHGTLQPLN